VVVLEYEHWCRHPPLSWGRCIVHPISASSWESIHQERACFEVQIVVLDALAYVVEIQPHVVCLIFVVGSQAAEEELLSLLFNEPSQAAGHCRFSAAMLCNWATVFPVDPVVYQNQSDSIIVRGGASPKIILWSPAITWQMSARCLKSRGTVYTNFVMVLTSLSESPVELSVDFNCICATTSGSSPDVLPWVALVDWDPKQKMLIAPGASEMSSRKFPFLTGCCAESC
jgi:hypothetical protein